MQQIIGACPHDCPDTCSILTEVEGGRAIKVRGNPAHPQTAGVLCNKVSKYTERTYAFDRLLQPLKRIGPKGPNAKFEPISWEQAISDIAEKLKAISSVDPTHILPYSYAGTMGKVQGESISSRFFNKLGATQLERTICSSAATQALNYSMGGKVGMKVEQFANSKLIIIWGSNSITSNLHFWRYANQAKANGAKLICIDPRRTETAEKCDVHLSIVPGTDAVLVFAIIRELVVKNAIDLDYLEKYTLGWDLLKERAMQWTLDKASKVCGLTPLEISGLAHDYATIKPAAIRLNYGIQRSKGGGNAVRAIVSLPAIIGAWRSPAGGALLANSGRFPTDIQTLQRPDLLTGSTPPTVNMSTIGQALHVKSHEHSHSTPHIKAVIVYNSNPVAVAPDSSKVASGFARNDLFTVVLEHFQTDTADYADYVLPATTQLEHWDIHSSYGHTDVLINKPAIPPVGQCKPNTQIFRELAQALGFDDPCFKDDDQALCRQAFEKTLPRMSFETLLDKGYYELEVPDAPYSSGNFGTPSKKFEFYSDRLAELGLDPLPTYIANYEPANPGAKYPLAMISPPARNFLNSSFVNVDAIHTSTFKSPYIEIHPKDAKERGVEIDSMVEVFNERGSYHCKVEITERTRPGLIVGLGIWWRKQGFNGTNINELTSQELTDFGNGPTFYDCSVQVRLLNSK